MDLLGSGPPCYLRGFSELAMLWIMDSVEQNDLLNSQIEFILVPEIEKQLIG